MIISTIVIAVSLSPLDFAVDAVSKRIAAGYPAASLSRFLDYPPSKGKLGFPRCVLEKPFELNDKFWLKDMDFSCVSPWNDAMGRYGAGVAVTKRHILYSNHFNIGKGTRILFVGQDGEMCPCYLEGSRRVGDTGLMVGLLNAEVTPNIIPAKVLPTDFAKYIGDAVGFPVVTFNQNEEAVLSESGRETKEGEGPRRWGALSSTNAAWKAYQKTLISGDSGNPAFMLIGNQPVLIYCIYGGGGGTGNSIHAYRREIQVAMDKLCPGYKLEEFDFTGLVPTITKVPDDP